MINDLLKQFGENKIISSKDILSFYKQYSQGTIYTMINKAIKNKELIKITNGYFFLPSNTNSKPKLDDVLNKLYLYDENNNQIGFKAGDYLIDQFSMLDSYDGNIKIITNIEHSCGRYVTLLDKQIYLQKPRVELTNENISAYILLELANSIHLYQFQDNEKKAWNKVVSFIRERKVTIYDVFNIMDKFPDYAFSIICKTMFFAPLTDQFEINNGKKIEEYKRF